LATLILLVAILFINHSLKVDKVPSIENLKEHVTSPPLEEREFQNSQETVVMKNTNGEE
jgi:hypothetical protein